MSGVSGVAQERPLELIFFLLLVGIMLAVLFGVEVIVDGLAVITAGFLGAISILIGAWLWKNGRFLMGLVFVLIGFAVFVILSLGWVGV